MTKLGDIAINIGIEVSEETIQRCCQLLQIYLSDHPDKIVMSQQGEYPMVWIENRVANKGEEND